MAHLPGQAFPGGVGGTIVVYWHGRVHMAIESRIRMYNVEKGRGEGGVGILSEIT